jgi:hypothetical protein
MDADNEGEPSNAAQQPTASPDFQAIIDEAIRKFAATQNFTPNPATSTPRKRGGNAWICQKGSVAYVREVKAVVKGRLSKEALSGWKVRLALQCPISRCSMYYTGIHPRYLFENY